MRLEKMATPDKDAVAQIVSGLLQSEEFGVERVPIGVSTYVYRVRSADDTFYLRLLPEVERSFAAEVHVHSLLRQLGVQVPEVIRFERRNEALGMSLMLAKEIPGSPLQECSSGDEYASVLVAAGKQLAIVHQVEVDGFGWVREGKDERESALLGENSSLHDELHAWLEQDLHVLSGNLFNRRERSRIADIFHTEAEGMARYGSRLVHGDFDDSHIFHQAARYTGMIDFGEIRGSSPLYDLGHFKLHDGQRYAGFDFLASGYNEVKRLTVDDRREIRLWALWIGVRRLGAIWNRPWGNYHEHLTRAVKAEFASLSGRFR